MKPHGPWRIVSTRDLYHDPWINVTVDDVIRPDGLPGTHSLIRIRAGVSVLPLDSEGHVYLADEFHYAIGRRSIETVSGGQEDDEQPAAAARRELQEELGIHAERWTDLGRVDPFTSNVLSPTQLFLAEALRFEEAAPEGTEEIRTVRLPLVEAVDWVLASRISHAPSCVLILKAAHHLQAR